MREKRLGISFSQADQREVHQFLFDDPLYKEHGIVLWPDITKDSAANPIWRMLSTPCDPDVWQAETGQVLVSKVARGGMNLAALFVAEDMQRNSGFWFRLSRGDKDTFVQSILLFSTLRGNLSLLLNSVTRSISFPSPTPLHLTGSQQQVL